MSRAILGVVLTVLAVPVPTQAQEPGDVLWSIPISHRDANISTAVGPDGSVYVHADNLYAIAPDGAVRWTRPLFDVDPVSVGADGTIYTGTIGGVIHAYAPDGTLRWTFDADHNTIAGPTVGPDGNLYVITEFGLGAYSLTPEGALRWNVAGFADFNGTPSRPIPFSAGQLYHATAEILPDDACGAGVRGMIALSLEGTVAWCTPLTTASQPAVSPEGDIYVTNGIAELRSYTPGGALRWFYNFPNAGSSFGLLEPAVGPDGDAYQFLSAELWGVDEAGGLQWTIDPTDGNVLSPMAVAPDDAVLVAGFARSGGQAGVVKGLDPATGLERWAVTLDVGERVSGRAVFSLDGNIVYLPVSTLSSSRLIAVQADEPATSAVAVTAEPVDGFVLIGPDGGTFEFAVTLTNTTSEPQTLQAWTAATGPVTREPVLAPRTVSLAAGQSLAQTLTQAVPGAAPAGDYTYTVKVGSYPDAVEASASFAVEKQADSRGARSGAAAPAWLVTGWADAATAATGLAVDVASGYALSEVYPNPFTPQARFTLAVAETQAVTVAVYDGLGRRVLVLQEGGGLAAGSHAFTLDGAALPSGVYVIRAVGETFTAVRRATLLR